MEDVTREEAIESVRKLLRYIGEDPDREGLLETPHRVIKSYGELFGGYSKDPKEVLQKTFPTRSDEMVVLSNIELYSTCEHHMLPFVGQCHIGYMPHKRVIGVSKLARWVEIYARRLQIQEELTHQIATALNDELSANGVAVLIEAKHMCMTSRGVQKQNAVLTTTALLGTFKTDLNLKKEFFKRIGR